MTGVVTGLQLFVPVPGEVRIGRYSISVWFIALVVISGLSVGYEWWQQRQRISLLETRLEPVLKVRGEKDLQIPIMEAYRRLKNSLEPGAYVIREAQMKVIEVTNKSDVGIGGVRVEVVDAAHLQGLPLALKWVHTDTDTADLAPQATGSVVVGMSTPLGVSLPKGGAREWVRGSGLVESPDGATMKVRVWAPGAMGEACVFRFERPQWTKMIRNRPADTTWLPNLVHEPDP